MPIPRPPSDLFLETYKGVDLFLYCADRGHRREGWDHTRDPFLIVQWDHVDGKDRGLVGPSLDAVRNATRHNIDTRKKIRFN